MENENIEIQAYSLRTNAVVSIMIAMEKFGEYIRSERENLLDFFHHDIARWFIVVHERGSIWVWEKGKITDFFYIFCRSSETCNIFIRHRRWGTQTAA